MTPAAENPRATLETRSIDAASLRRFLADAEGDRVISPQVLGRLLGHATRHSHDDRIDVEVLTIEPHGGASCCRAAEEKLARRLVREFRQNARIDAPLISQTWKAAAGAVLAASGMTIEPAIPDKGAPERLEKTLGEAFGPAARLREVTSGYGCPGCGHDEHSGTCEVCGCSRSSSPSSDPPSS